MIQDPRDLFKSYGEVASLPVIYHRINMTINNPRTSMEDIGKIIREDPGLTVRLLRLVNSAFYGFPSKIQTVTQALVLIGTRQLCDLALATTMITIFQGIPKDLVDMESFWRHSIACGVAAKILATYRREANIERFFVSGMIHDIGRLILYRKNGGQAREILLQSESKGALLVRVEQEVLGFDHATLGAMLLQWWNLPSGIVEAVACHHRPHDAWLYPVEAAAVHVADLLANALQRGSSGERFVPPLDAKAWDVLGLSTNILSPALDHLEQQLDEMVHSILGE